MTRECTLQNLTDARTHARKSLFDVYELAEFAYSARRSSDQAAQSLLENLLRESIPYQRLFDECRGAWQRLALVYSPPPTWNGIPASSVTEWVVRLRMHVTACIRNASCEDAETLARFGLTMAEAATPAIVPSWPNAADRLRARLPNLPDRAQIDTLLNLEHDHAANALNQYAQPLECPVVKVRSFVLAEDPEFNQRERYRDMLRRELSSHPDQQTGGSEEAVAADPLLGELLKLQDEWTSIAAEYEADNSDAKRRCVIEVSRQAGVFFIDRFGPLAAQIVERFELGSFLKSLPVPCAPSPDQIRSAGYSIEDFFDVRVTSDAGLRGLQWAALGHEPERYNRGGGCRGEIRDWASQLLTFDREVSKDWASDEGRFASGTHSFSINGIVASQSGDSEALLHFRRKRVRTWREPFQWMLLAYRELAHANAKSAMGQSASLQAITADEYEKLIEIKDVFAPNDSYLGLSITILKLFEQIELLNRQADKPVLLLGPTGAGKSKLAELIHAASPRRDKAFQCEQAAFTATSDPALMRGKWCGYGEGHGLHNVNSKGQEGLLKSCAGGTIFLDELAEVTKDFQTFLLQLLDRSPIGPFMGKGAQYVPDVRLILATNKDLETEVGAKRFAHDLFDRIRRYAIIVPPLKERKEDIPQFVRACFGKKRWSFRFLAALLRHNWPGNCRELIETLENARQRAASAAEYVDVKHLPPEFHRLVDGLTEDQARAMTYRWLVELSMRQGFAKGRRGLALNKRIADLLGVTESAVTQAIQDLSPDVADE